LCHRAALRKGEDIKVSDFSQDLFIIRGDGNVDGLAVQICCKSVKQIITLMIWVNEQIKLFPICQLLIYIYIS
jgi:hypothetical protein